MSGGDGFLPPGGGSGGGSGGNVTIVGDDVGLATEHTLAQRFGGGFITTGMVISSSGDSVLYTPAAGRRAKLHWFGMSSSQNNTAEVLAIVKIGLLLVYAWYMGNPGGFSHWESITGDVDAPLIVNLTAGGQNVAVNFTVEDV